MAYWEATLYPRIFKRTYWGSFNNSDLIDRQIIDNRNHFVEEFEIIKYVDDSIGVTTHILFDHQELYKCKNGYIFIVSPYGPHQDVSKHAKDIGMIEYLKLYTLNATTYLKTFSDKYEFNSWKKKQSAFYRPSIK